MWCRLQTDSTLWWWAGGQHTAHSTALLAARLRAAGRGVARRGGAGRGGVLKERAACRGAARQSPPFARCEWPMPAAVHTAAIPRAAVIITVVVVVVTQVLS